MTIFNYWDEKERLWKPIAGCVEPHLYVYVQSKDNPGHWDRMRESEMHLIFHKPVLLVPHLIGVDWDRPREGPEQSDPCLLVPVIDEEELVP
jgi:hypothetical protein